MRSSPRFWVKRKVVDALNKEIRGNMERELQEKVRNL